MKQKCSSILKIAVALVLALLMVFGSVSTVLAAVVQPALLGAASSVAGTAANADLAGTAYNEFNQKYLYVDMSSYSSNTLTGVNAYWNYECNDGNMWNTTKTDMGDNIYRFDLSTMNGSYLYFRGFKVVTSGTSNTLGVVNGQTNNMIKVSSTGTLSWTSFSAYYVASGDNSFTGTSWSSNDVNGKMSKSGTNYVKTFNNVDAKTYKYKVCKDGLWYTTYPSDNATCEVPFNGATIQITKDSLNNVSHTVKYTHTASSATNGTVGVGSANGTSLTTDYAAGTTTYTIYATPASNYVVDKISVGGSVIYTNTGNTTGQVTQTRTYAGNETVSATFRAVETTYTVTVNSENTDKGTVESSSVSAGATNAVILPTATPKYGYKFKNWTTSSSKITITNATSRTAATVKATGAGTVTANFVPNDELNLYAVGRFKVKDSGDTWHYVGGSQNAWNETYTSDANLKFTATSTDFVYKLETNASLAELSTGSQYLRVYDKDYPKTFGPSGSDAVIGVSTAKTVLAENTGKSMYFDSQLPDSPVTIYFNTNTKEIWYDVPGFYSVTVAQATNGSMTADPVRTSAGSTVTLNATPNKGYALSSVTVKKGNTSVTVNGTGNTRTFTMPAGDVTVTPVFTAVNYTVSAEGKYTNDGTNYNQSFTTSPVTCSASSATYAAGVTVTAADVDGYQFVEWSVANGDIGNKLDKSTTFKPTADGAKATAKYKKIFTITTSVDSDGTGAGSVPTIEITSGAVAGQTNKILAGGNYKITANPTGSYSELESIKINGGSAITTSPYTKTAVSEDQSVVVKYKSKVYLRGGSTIGGSSWNPGDVMQANADGTKYTKSYSAVVGASGGTTYEFKLYNGSYSEDGTATVAITGGDKTGSVTAAGQGTNYKLILKKEANVTIESDGSKITKITVVPTTITRHTVTFKKVVGSTITGEYDGESFSTASADAAVSVYDTDEISFTVTADSGKYISGLSGATFTPVFAVTNEYEGKIASVTGDLTITPAVGDNATITPVTNKSSRGTVSVSPTTAHQGETITITVSPKNGTLTALSITYASSGDIYDCNLSTKAWTKRGDASTGVAAKGDLASIGAAIASLVATGADNTYTFTMAETSNVTVNATYSAYSGTSAYYYNGYDTSGNALSDYTAKQMTEGILNGVPYSYYKVSGRTGTDQLMTVSKKTSDLPTTIYFTRPNTGGWESYGVRAYFFDDSGNAVGDAWPGAWTTYIGKNDYQEDIDSISVPSGATKVVFNNDNHGQQTPDITLSGDVNAYYFSNGNVGSYIYGTLDTNTEYWYNASNRYYGAVTGFTDKGWGSNNAGSHNSDNNRFAKPNEDLNGKGDYYILVFYAGNTYTSGSGTLNLTGNDNHDVVMWSYNLPDDAGDGETVTLYAKDGTIDTDTKTYADLATTVVYNEDGTTSKEGRVNASTTQGYVKCSVEKGETIVVKTTVSSDYKAKYYVRGFMVNGEVPKNTLITTPDTTNGVYTLTYTVPEDFEGSKIEITPVYYLVDTTNNKIVTFRVTGFTDTLKQVGSGKPGWGDTLYVYPFYAQLGSYNNSFGGYPGQPMINYNGQWSVQIPEKSTAWAYDDSNGKHEGASNLNDVHTKMIGGITLSNGYYDSVHKSIMGYGDNGSKTDHVQTYDYDDFYKIYNEKGVKSNTSVDNIVLDFKYETDNDNKTDQSSFGNSGKTVKQFTDTFTNGFEDLLNYHGRHVNIYGDALSGDNADPTKTAPLYVVSVAGPTTQNVAGYYGTEWAIYVPSTTNPATATYSLVTGGGKSSIPPSLLLLNDDDSFSDNSYTSATSHTSDEWKDLYDALANYKTYPVMITYEKAKTEADAIRNDGRWLYSKNGEIITSSIRIDVSDDNGETWTNNATAGKTGLSAYFTNSEVAEGATTFSTTIDPDKTYNFEAMSSNANYMFDGWYFDNGVKITSDNDGSTERSGSYTFVARFKLVTEGQLVIQHTTDTSGSYKGSGSSKVSVVIKNGDETLITYPEADSITIPRKYISSTTLDYEINVTLKATPSGYDTYHATSLVTDTYATNAKFYNNVASSTEGSNPVTQVKTFKFTVRDLYAANGTTQNVLSLLYHSDFNKTEFTYDLTFKYDGRLAKNQFYRRTGTLTAAQVKDYVSGSAGNYTLDKSFITDLKLAPAESNFNETLIWTLSDITSSSPAFVKDNFTATVLNTAMEGQKLRSTSRKATFDMGDGNATTTYDVTYGELIKNNGNYIVAPVTLNNNKFAYWKIETADSDSTKRTEVARCYNNQFNYIAYDNYYITAVYDNDFKYGENRVSASINYLDTTRNQWNDNGNGGYIVSGQDSRNKASDILFNDFALAYDYNGQRLYESNDAVDGKDVEVGFVVEKVQKMNLKQDGTYDSNVADYVPTEATDISTAKANAQAAITGINVSGYGAKAGDKNSNYANYTKYKLDRTKLDNKNRIEFFYALYNGYGMNTDGTGATKLAAKNYVYRAYSYIKVGDVYTISDNPAYFIMYDEATK